MANVRLIRAATLSLVLFLSLSQSGCSVFSALGGWISQGYDNTVSYFNAYYNAKTLFDQAEAEVLAARSAMKPKVASTFAPLSGYPGSPAFPGSQGTVSPSPGFPQTPMPQSAQPQAPQQTSSTAKQKFASVIDKCSNILSFYPKSSVVDDALFLIGKSYFYQDEFVRAERKFSELIVQDPNGPLALNAQLWLLKTLQRLVRLDDANRVGNELVDAATKADETEIAAEALEILGDVAVAQNKSEAAIELYGKAVATADNGPLRASAQSKIGDIHAAGQQYEKAASAYTDVSKYSPDPYGYYSSQMQCAIVRRRLGQFDASVEILRKLESDYRFMDFLGTVRFEMASTFAAQQKIDDAVNLYKLVDTTNVRTEQGARAAFELGRIMQLTLGDYAGARIAYTHATAGGPQDLTQESQRRVTAFDKYFRLSEQFSRLDSIYFIADIDSMWTRVDSSSLAGKTIQRDSSGSATRRDSLTTPQRRDTIRTEIDSLTYHGDKAVAKQVPDTSSSRKVIEGTPGSASKLPTIVVKPRKDTLVASLGNLAYQLGELFYTELDVPDSTFLWLNQAVKLGLDSVKSVRAMFVLAEVARANPEKKYGDEKDLYRTIVSRYPKSSYAEQARIALGFPPTPRKEDPAAATFVVAESLMYAGKYQQAVDSLGRIVRDFPESPLTPKSRYAMAWIYENNLANPDSALSQFKTLVAKHAGSKYADAAQRRIPPPVADTSAKAGIDPAKKAAADTTSKAPLPGPGKVSPDTTVKPLIRLQTPPDSLFNRSDPDDENVGKRAQPRDTTAVRRRR